MITEISWSQSALLLVIRLKMRSQRPDKKGSFGGQVDQLVEQFPHVLPARSTRPIDKRELQDKRDIHALLFERAWNIDRKKEGED